MVDQRLVPCFNDIEKFVNSDMQFVLSDPEKDLMKIYILRSTEYWDVEHDQIFFEDELKDEFIKTILSKLQDVWYKFCQGQPSEGDLSIAASFVWNVIDRKRTMT